MRLWEMNIRRVVPYVPGDQPTGDRLIKLNTSENPYPPAPGVERALKETDVDRLHKYPDPSSAELVKTLAEYYGVGEGQVFVGVGSDDAIAMSFLVFFNSQKPVLFPDIAYSFYRVWADLYRISYEMPALDENMTIRPLDYEGENGGIIFPNPNALIGVYMPPDQVEETVKADQDIIVTVDEAYTDSAGPSARELLSGYDNLLVAQTFSKSRSMVGMRIDFALGSPVLIKALDDVKYSYSFYTMNLPSQLAGTQIVKGRVYPEEARAKIMDTREHAEKRFAELGFTSPDSMTNFILVIHERVPTKAIFDALKKERIYVRYLDVPKLDNSFQVSTGTDEKMDALSRFLEQYLEEWKPAGDSE